MAGDGSKEAAKKRHPSVWRPTKISKITLLPLPPGMEPTWGSDSIPIMGSRPLKQGLKKVGPSPLRRKLNGVKGSLGTTAGGTRVLHVVVPCQVSSRIWTQDQKTKKKKKKKKTGRSSPDDSIPAELERCLRTAVNPIGDAPAKGLLIAYDANQKLARRRLRLLGYGKHELFSMLLVGQSDDILAMKAKLQGKTGMLMSPLRLKDNLGPVSGEAILIDPKRPTTPQRPDRAPRRGG